MSDRRIRGLRTTFGEMHQSGFFVLPNPWDTGSARLLESLGFRALATTSSGNAWSCGRADGQLSRAETLEQLRAMAQACALYFTQSTKETQSRI